MARYIPFLKYQIDLLNYKDLMVYESFDELKEIGKNRIDKNYIFEKCFDENDDRLFLTSLMLMFPYLFFMDENYFDKERLKSAIQKSNRIKDKLNFQHLIFLRLNQKNIDEALGRISNGRKNRVNQKNFVTTLAKYLYYHAFFTLLKTISFDGKTTFLDYLELLRKVERELRKTSNHGYVLGLSTSKPAVNYFLKEFYERFRREYQIDDKSFEENLLLFEILNRNSDVSKLLYSSIDFNIELNPQFSTQKKNKLLRPLFYEIVCKVCYTSHYHQKWTNNEVTRKFSDFLKSYTKYLKNKDLK